MSTIQYSNAYHSIYNGFNINNYYIHYYKNVFAHKRYYYANATSTFSFSASMFRVHKYACGLINEYTYENGIQLESL